MAWEFRYQLCLDLSHFEMDPREITNRIAVVRPSHVTKISDEKRMKSGAVRVATNSVWIARLHESEFLNSVSHNFRDALRQRLAKLQPYGDLFREVRQNGYAYLRVVWFSDTGHSVGIIPADVLAMCGSIGLDLDLEYYAPVEMKVEAG